jgi:hypothetical protein
VPIESSVIRDFDQRVALTVIALNPTPENSTKSSGGRRVDRKTLQHHRRPGEARDPDPQAAVVGEGRRPSVKQRSPLRMGPGSRSLSLAVRDDVDLMTRSSRAVVIASASEAIHAATREKLDCFVADAPRNDGQELASATAVIPAKAGIQYAAAYPFHRRRLLNTGSSAFADDDN